MSSSSAIASMPAYPPPTSTNVNARRRVAGSVVVAAMSNRDSTWLRSQIASPIVLKPTAYSVSPGIGSVRDTEPGGTTISSYRISRAGPVIGWTVATRRACSTFVRSEEHTSELQSHHDLVCRLLLEKQKQKTN